MPSGVFPEEVLDLPLQATDADASRRLGRRIPGGPEAHPEARGTTQVPGEPAYQEGVGHQGLAQAHDPRLEHSLREGGVGREGAQEFFHGGGKVTPSNGAHLAREVAGFSVPVFAERMVADVRARFRKDRRR